MSKYVKDLITNDVRKRLDGVENALLVNVIGLKSDQSVALRKKLREKQIKLLVIKNSLARRAAEGTSLAPAFEGAKGTLALVWGSEDVVSLAKEIVKIAGDAAFAPFEVKGGAMDGQSLTADEATAVSKWPSRQEQLSLLVGQILSPGAMLSSQLLSPARKLASQVKKKGEEGGE